MEKHKLKRLIAVISAFLMIMSLFVLPIKTALADDSVPTDSPPAVTEQPSDTSQPSDTPAPTDMAGLTPMNTPEPSPTGTDEVPPDDTPTLSDDAKLSSLTVTAGGNELTLSPEFSSDITNYTVSTTEHQIDIEATANAAPFATVSGLGKEEFGYGGGEKTFPVTVTAQDGTQQTYSIVVTCSPSDNADLKSLSVKHGGKELLDGSTPALTFDPGTASYAIDTDAMYIDITAAAEDRYATGVAAYNGTDPVPLDEGKWRFALIDGENDLKVTATAEDGTTTKDYDITVNCGAGKDDYLKSLTVSYGGTAQAFDKYFSPDVSNYNLTLGSGKTPVDISAEAENGSAAINGATGTYSQSGVALTDGETLKVTVTSSSDGSVSKEYDIKINLVEKLTGVSGDFKYEIRNSNIAITGYTGGGDAIIPDTINVNGTDLTVKEIGEGAFENNIDVTYVKLPHGLTEIGEKAFSRCSNLKYVTFNAALITIGDYAFESCDDLGNIVLPDSLETIGDYAFESCDNLGNIVLPDSLETIGDCAFEDCWIDNINIPANVTSIGGGFVYGCIWLKTITVNSANKYYTVSEDGILFSKDLKTLITCPTNYGKPDNWESDNTVDYIVPDSVTAICDYAFGGCHYIKNITLPASLTSVSGLAFAGANMINFLINEGNTSYKVGADGVLYSYDETRLIACLDGSLQDNGEEDEDYFCWFTVPSGVNEIGRGAFAGSFIDDIRFENRTEPIKIDAYAFYDCEELDTVTIPCIVSSVGAEAFGNCGLQSATFEVNDDTKEALGTLSSTTFEGCVNLNAIYFEGNAPKVDTGDSAAVFPDCSHYLTIFHVKNSTGFKSTWSGYPLAVFDPDVKYMVKYYSSDDNGDYEIRSVFKGGKTTYIDLNSDDEYYSGDDDSDVAFLGWYKDRYCTKPWCFGTDKVTSNMNLFAGWADPYNNAYLDYISLYDADGNEIVSSPEFNPKGYTYKASINGSYFEADFDPDDDEDADVYVNGRLCNNYDEDYGYYYDVNNIKPGQTVNLTIMVKNGKLKKTYALSVKRQASEDNLLTGIGNSTGTLDPVFSSTTNIYKLKLDKDTGSVTIKPVLSDTQYAKLYIDGKVKASKTYKLNPGGSLPCTITVVSQAGVANPYTITISRDPNTDDLLSSLKTDSKKYKISPAFDKNKADGYTVTLPETVGYVTLYAAPEGYGATTKITNENNTASFSTKGSLKVPVGNGLSVSVKITVTAQASTADEPITKDYTVTVCRKPTISSFSATPKSGKYPAISPGGDNALTFNWTQGGDGTVTLQIYKNKAEGWVNIDSDVYSSGANHYDWDGSHDWNGNLMGLSVGLHMARIMVTNEYGVSSPKTLTLKILPSTVS